MWNFHFTYKIGTFPHVKYLIHMWNELVQNLTCEILVEVLQKICISHAKWNIHLLKLISHMKFSFHMWNWNNSHMKYYFLMWTFMWNFCKGILHITRKQNKIEYPYKLQNILLDGGNCERVLGVWTTGSLTWSKHILAVFPSQPTGGISSKKYEEHSQIQCLSNTLFSSCSFTAGFRITRVGSAVGQLDHEGRTYSKLTNEIYAGPFISCSISYNERLLMSKLPPLCYWPE